MDTQKLVDNLFKAGAHFGYSRARRHPSVSPFIFGTKGGIELFDLEQTAAQLEAAMTFIRSRAADRQKVVIVGGKAEARGAVVRTAEALNLPYVSGRFIGGCLTNFSEIQKRILRLAELTTMREKGELAKFTKLERLHIDREITDLTTMFGGLSGMEKLPAALVVIDPRREHIAVTEAQKLGIPVVALLNSDCDARGITYPVAANDATVASITFFLSKVAEAWEEGTRAAAPVKEVAADVPAAE